MAPSEERTRLHIAPFNSSLYSTIIAPRLQPLATGLSYHKTQTDINGGFGYIELPKLEADKLRNKLNGTVLRGAKMKVELAKPEKRKQAQLDAEAAAAAAETGEPTEEADEEEKPRKKKVKKSKRKDGEFKGFEIPDGREIKRGWTEDPKAARTNARHEREDEDKKPAERKRKQEKSKFTASKEVLFKTQLPEKAIGIAAEQAKKDKKDKKEKKLKDRKGKKEAVVIHEFEKNVQFPSFLRAEKTGTGKVAHEYVDGKGWVDEDGELVEKLDAKPKREDRLAKMPQNRVVPMNASDSEGEDEMAARTQKETKKEKKSKEVVWAENDVPQEEDAMKKEELARINRLLDDEGSDSEEVIKNAASKSEEDDEVDSEEEEEDDEKAEEETEADIGAQDEHRVEEERMTASTGKNEDQDMVDADDVSSSDDEEVAEMDKEPADRETAKSGKTMEIATPQQQSDNSEESAVEGAVSSADDDSDAEESDDAESTPKALASTGPDVSTPTPEDEQPAKEIHPLEALYKRPKSSGTPNKPTPIKTGFSFGFGGGDDDGSDDDTEHAPQTPFSSQELRGRRSRSAAPTPDTAAIGKRFSFSLGRGDGYDNYDEEDEDEYYDDMAAVNEPAYVPSRHAQHNKWEEENQKYPEKSTQPNKAIEALAESKDGEESGFAKWFWENRGDSNRGWKKRRREELKVGRQRENRRIGRKVV